MTVTIDDAALKARHRGMWASGDYPRMVETFLLPLGPRLVEACDIAPGATVLDIAAGTGNASLPAAARGARVTASDALPVPAAMSSTVAPGAMSHASTSRGPRGSRNVSTIRG